MFVKYSFVNVCYVCCPVGQGSEGAARSAKVNLWVKQKKQVIHNSGYFS